jgi:hypothetical protein
MNKNSLNNVRETAKLTFKKEYASEIPAHTATATPFPPGPEATRKAKEREKEKAKRVRMEKEKAKREKEKERKEKERGRREKEKAKRAKAKVKRIMAKGKVNSGVQLAKLLIIHGRTVGRIPIVNSHGTKVAKARAKKVANHGDRIPLNLNRIGSHGIHGQIHRTVHDLYRHKDCPICATTTRKGNVSWEMLVASLIIRTGDAQDQVLQEVTGINNT